MTDRRPASTPAPAPPSRSSPPETTPARGRPRWPPRRSPRPPPLEALGRDGRAALLRALRRRARGAPRRTSSPSPTARPASATARLNGELTRTTLPAPALRRASSTRAATSRPPIDHAGDTPDGPAARPAPHARAARPGRGLRRQQLPARVLRARRRHRLGARRRLPRSSSRRTAPTRRRRSCASTSWSPPRATPARPTARSASCTASRPAPTSSPTRPIRAVGFTGSAAGGRRCCDVIETRPDPIPFFGELSSLNPVVVTPAAAAERGDAHRRASWSAPFTLGAGQFCTKPGLAFVPAGAGGRRARRRACATPSRRRAPQVLLNAGHRRRLRPDLGPPGRPWPASPPSPGARPRRRPASGGAAAAHHDGGRAAARGDRGVLRPGHRRRPVRRRAELFDRPRRPAVLADRHRAPRRGRDRPARSS